MHEQFDPSQFKLNTLVDPTLVTEALLTNIPVGKPDRQQFIRTHPDTDYTYDAAILEYDGETYLVAANMLTALQGEYRAVRLQVAIARHSTVPFLWPLKLPQGDGRPNMWNETAMMAAREAQTAWVRVMSDMTQGMYVTKKAMGIDDDPVWPDQSMEELLRIAFQGKTITELKHPVVQKLLGHA